MYIISACFLLLGLAVGILAGPLHSNLEVRQKGQHAPYEEPTPENQPVVSYCHSYYLQANQHYTLWAQCYKNGEGFKWSRLDLRTCLGNDDGQLVWDAHGHAHDSCRPRSCSMRRWPEYTCACQSRLGSWGNTAIDLSDGQDVDGAPIGHNSGKGVLTCLGIQGERDQCEGRLVELPYVVLFDHQLRSFNETEVRLC
ncbi:hypothetical protein SODALDRAFT_379562 [Sodiomyces alkalinus F11]|uniref:Cyanovirin-N domain-containing protein n=1 Tax=Sodiomyces alkalinus (strain CBS 110278 / VKM F-3762 / F11) TaxID=1314773 RepID=A0A3N2PRL8_SODAK|nr:hypothetical protein SODALDRAFT_379562 [Sodiomyces alkalinus F11]ROT37074.1 hypothetical protein SODALDRAFT_379562 [Sodiomyces alkalinus F11]